MVRQLSSPLHFPSFEHDKEPCQNGAICKRLCSNESSAVHDARRPYSSARSNYLSCVLVQSEIETEHGFSYLRSKALESTDERIMLPTNDGHSHLEMYKDDQSFASDDALSITINSIPSPIDLLDHSPFSRSVA
jgi:hypothetical protein